MKKIKLIVFLISVFVCSANLHAQKETPSLLVSLRYFVVNNGYQYLAVQTKIKAENKIKPVKDVVLQLYLDSMTAEDLLGKVRTNEKGEASCPIPFSFKDQWVRSDRHKFIAVAEATQKSDETVSELEIAKARIAIDTLNEDGTRSVTARVESLQNGTWIPQKDVELKLGVKRLGGILRINDSESASTDSTGSATGEFQLSGLPAEEGKNITLVAQVEDHEQFGNLSVEKTVPWGASVIHENNFNKRSLWATRDKAPVWLLLMAYSIMAGVWGVLVYLVVQLFRIRRMGKAEDEPASAQHADLRKLKGQEVV